MSGVNAFGMRAIYKTEMARTLRTVWQCTVCTESVPDSICTLCRTLRTVWQ